MHHQDWKEVVFKKPMGKTQIQTKTRTTGVETASSVSSKPAWKIEMDVDSETSKRPLELVTREDAQRIIRGRCDKKLTQRDLATKLNMQVGVIQDIETCKAVENKAVLGRIKRYLNITS
jgi:ribosome-binding protein aMBF1 (putative translation factor)